MSPGLPFDIEDERHAALTADEEAIIQATHQLHGVDGTVGNCGQLGIQPAEINRLQTRGCLVVPYLTREQWHQQSTLLF
jgi:hypothetical protein